MEKGTKNRHVGATKMNSESSRSHSVLSTTIECSVKSSITGVTSTRTSTFNIIDLAGSERTKDTHAQGERLKEAGQINKSLSALGDVISSLTSNSAHIPYRNHPLTMLMSDSIGGNAKTLMFVNTSPADYNSSETNSSLSFGNRCKDITNAVAAPPHVQAQQLKALQKELAKLKKDGKKSEGPQLLKPGA